MQIICKLVFVTSLLLLACSCSFFDHSPDNFTDTVRLVTKRVFLDPKTPYKLPGPTYSKLLMIRQKTDSTLRLSCYRNYPDSSTLLGFLINSKNDSFKLISSTSDLTLTRVFEDKEDPSVKIYKYETKYEIGPINLSFLFSKEHGYLGAGSQAHGEAVLVTHWNGKPLDKRYQELLRSNLKLILTPEWESPARRRRRIGRSRHPAQ